MNEELKTALTADEIDALYVKATGQTLREGDKRLAHGFARTIERALRAAPPAPVGGAVNVDTISSLILDAMVDFHECHGIPGDADHVAMLTQMARHAAISMTDMLSAPLTSEGGREPVAKMTLSDFREGQWWVAELDTWAKSGSDDQKRAVAVVHHMLRSARLAEKQPSEDKRDAERLDWLIERQAWIQWTVRDGSIRQCQVYDQDEDEEYHILSGDARYFDTPRAALDAAIAKGEGK